MSLVLRAPMGGRGGMKRRHRLARGSAGGCPGALLHSPAGRECWLQAGALGSLPGLQDLAGISYSATSLLS